MLRAASFRSAALLAAVAIQLAGALLLSGWSGRWVELPLHAVLELGGAAIAAHLLLVLLRRDAGDDAAHPALLAALLVTAIFDAVHATCDDGAALFWTRALGTALAGLLCAAQLAPPPRVAPRRILRAAAILALLLGGAVLALGGRLPDRSATMWAIVTLATGGAGWIAGAAVLVVRYRRRRDVTLLVLACLALFLGAGALLASAAHKWTPAWWFAHVVRLAAFALALQIVFGASRELRARLAQSQEDYGRLWQKLETILALTDAGKFLIDASGACTYANPAGARLLAADDGTLRAVLAARAAATQVELGGRMYHAGFRAIPGEGGVLTVRDVTELEEQVRARTAEVDAQRRLFETTLQQLPVAVIIGEAPSGRLIFANERTEQVWGHGLLPSRSIAEYRTWRGLHADGRPYEPEDWPLARAIRHGEVTLGEETRIVRGDGATATLLLSAAPVRDAAGTIVAGVVVCKDVTQRLATERALRLVERRLRAIVDNTPITVFELDAARRYVSCEGAGLARYGITPSAIVGRELGSLSGRGSWFEQLIERTYAGESASGEGPIRDGWITTHTAPIRDEHGAVVGVLGLTLDVSERRRAQEAQAQHAARAAAAVEASQLKSAFLANMSHEIRTPLNGVLGLAGLLLDTSLTREQRELADGIKQSGSSLLTVINDILDLSKVEAGKLELEAIDFTLRPLVEDTVKLFRHVAAEKHVHLTCELDVSLPRQVRGDPGRIRQILNNLIGNALKFTSSGRVSVRATAAPAVAGRIGLQFEVEDTGPGIAPEIRAALFRPFVQGDASTSRRFGGTGLGLSICRGLVEQMHGAIDVASEPGRGARFFFRIELEPTAAEASSTRSSASTPPVPRRARVLVAEDNGVNLLIAVRLLERAGITADAVGNGLEALMALERFPYDLVLMDCQMPEMDGYEATRRIRASSTLARPALPVIAMTASAIRGDRERCLEAGMDDYVPKPIDPDRLYATIDRWLQRAG